MIVDDWFRKKIHKLASADVVSNWWHIWGSANYVPTVLVVLGDKNKNMIWFYV